MLSKILIAQVQNGGLTTSKSQQDIQLIVKLAYMMIYQHSRMLYCSLGHFALNLCIMHIYENALHMIYGLW